MKMKIIFVCVVLASSLGKHGIAQAADKNLEGCHVQPYFSSGDGDERDTLKTVYESALGIIMWSDDSHAFSLEVSKMPSVINYLPLDSSNNLNERKNHALLGKAVYYERPKIVALLLRCGAQPMYLVLPLRGVQPLVYKSLLEYALDEVDNFTQLAKKTEYERIHPLVQKSQQNYKKIVGLLSGRSEEEEDRRQEREAQEAANEKFLLELEKKICSDGTCIVS